MPICRVAGAAQQPPPSPLWVASGPSYRVPAAGKLVQVNGPQGNLSAVRIDMVLNKEDGRADRLEAYQQVTARIDTKTATADRLTYLAATDQYDMVGAERVPVLVLDRVADRCRQMSGKTLTYYKTDNRIVVDGKELRQQSTSAACPPSPARPAE